MRVDSRSLLLALLASAGLAGCEERGPAPILGTLEWDRVAMTAEADDIPSPLPESKLAQRVVGPLVERGKAAFLSELEGVTVEDLCVRAKAEGAIDALPTGDFTI